jgi:hypothetical protein
VNPTKPDSHASGLKTLTDWYPADVKPVRVGVYETKSPVLAGDPGWYAYWNGDAWSWGFLSKYSAYLKRKERGKFQNRQWRGLTEQAK